MEWLNYHHLLYFWTVAQEGSVKGASEKLHLSQPALSTQIRHLETSLGEKLFEKAGRGLKLTEAGRLAYRYADEIFNLGREFQSELKGKPTGRPMRLMVGATDVLPKLMVHRLLWPALRLPEALRLSCKEGDLPELVQMLLDHELDLVFSDLPQPGPRVFNHLLGECDVELLAAPSLLRRYPGPYPEGLDGAPMLMPYMGHAIRRSLDAWLESREIRPVIAGEFDDSSLMKTFGAAGEGFFIAMSPIAARAADMYRVERVCRLDGLKEKIYALSGERKLVHPAVQAILKGAKHDAFRGEEPS